MESPKATTAAPSYRKRPYCYICWKNEELPAGQAIAVCNENNRPVCNRHARGCQEDGHGTRPLLVAEVRP